jgi:hypothetical protein
MSKTLEERIKGLERELALKQAYLSVQFSFPKGSKLPDDVKEQVTEELKKACAQLADDKGVVVNHSSASSEFSEDEVSVLKQVVEAAKSKMSAVKPPKMQGTVETAPKTDAIPRNAILLTNDNIPANIRMKIGSNEAVFVKESSDGTSFVVTRDGMGFRVPTEDLDFNL